LADRFLDFEDLMKIPCVWKEWAAFAKDRVLWNDLYQEKLAQLVAAACAGSEEGAEERGGAEDDLGVQLRACDVRFASRRRLIEFLTAEAHGDPIFMKTFLTTYPTFMPARLLLVRMIQRYDAHAPPLASRAPMLPIQIRVCNVLRNWIEEFAWDFDPAMLQLAQLFVQARVRCAGHHDVARIVAHSLASARAARLRGSRRIISPGRAFSPREVSAPLASRRNSVTAGERALSPPASCSPPPALPPALGGGAPGAVPALQLDWAAALQIDLLAPAPPPPASAWARWLACDDEALARQLTLRDADLLAEIPREELLNCRWQRPAGAPRVAAMVERFNAVCVGVSYGLLLAPTAKERAKGVHKLVRVAAHLRALNSFHSLCAILSALRQAVLRECVGKLPRDARRQLDELLDLTSSVENHRRYRAHLAHTAPPAVPFVVLALRDLAAIEDCNVSSLNGLINFPKRRLIYNVISQLRTFQVVPYAFSSQAELLQLFDSVFTPVEEGQLLALTQSMTADASRR
jgi:hypothetical protein